MPAHPVALELIRLVCVPNAAPSANRFGHTSPTTADHVLDDLDGRIDAVVDSGPSSYGVESTVVGPSSDSNGGLLVYRPGAITLDQLRAIAGKVELFSEEMKSSSQPRTALPSPGVGLRHYAPKARLILLQPDANGAFSVPPGLTGKVGIMQPTGFPTTVLNSVRATANATFVYPWGEWDHLESLAQLLYAGLRYLDRMDCTEILCPVPPRQGIGRAIRDRLRKASYPREEA